MKTILQISGFVALLVLFSCTENNTGTPEQTPEEVVLVGNVQKGPFINGSDVFIYELDEHFSPTGRTFHTNTDDKGYFELKGIQWKSQYVELLADGFYFNEVEGDLSAEKLSLKAVVDLTKNSNMNINVLTNLEYERVKKLIFDNNLSLEEAKNQAQEEILGIFHLDTVSISNAESLDIVKSGEGDAVLLAISAILQSNRTTSELSKLLADMAQDLKPDGILDDSIIKGSLVSYAAILNVNNVKQNLISKYNDLGVAIGNTNNFESYVKYFIDHSDNPVISPVEFVNATSNGPNMLLPELTNLQPELHYSLAAKMPKTGKLMVKIKRTDGNGYWWYTMGSVYGWKVGDYNVSTNEQTFTSTVNGETIDMLIFFSEYGKATVEYFYNESPEPFYAKTITWGGYNNSDFIFHNDSPLGNNLLALNDSSFLKRDTSYTVGLYNNTDYDVNFTIQLPPEMTVEVTGGWGDYSYNLSGNQFGFELKGNGPTEIGIKFSGVGPITLTSDLHFKDGNYLTRAFLVTE